MTASPHRRFRVPTLLLCALAIPVSTPAARRPASPIPTTTERTFAATETTDWTVFDFVESRRRAHLRSGGLIIDFGDTGYEKYTGLTKTAVWRTQHDGETGTDFAAMTGTKGTVRFRLSAEETKQAALGIRARAGSALRLAIYLNGERLGDAALSRGEFRYFAFDNAPVQEGENLLELFPKSESGTAGGGLGVDLDFLQIRPEPASVVGGERSSEAPGGVETVENGTLILAEEAELTYAMFVPASTALRVEAEPEDSTGGRLQLRVTGGSAVVDQLQESDAEEIALAPFAGEAAEISFRAVMGPVRLKSARLVRSSIERSVDPRALGARNLIVVLIDTLRRDRLSTYNPATEVSAPGLRRLAAESLVFDNAVAQSSWTKPSTATLLTGLYPSTHRADTHAAILPESIETLPAVLQAQGITTAAFVQNGYISDRFGFGKGWDSFEMYDVKNDPARGPKMVTDLLGWVSRRAPEERFFAYVHTTEVHAPYRSPKTVWSRYDSARYRGGIRPAETVGLLNRVREGTLIPALRDRIRLTALYNGAISFHDRTLGRLLRALKQLGTLEDTAILLTSDHGEEFFGHGSVGHGHTLHGELVRVPLMLRLPEQSRISPRHIGAPVGLVDALPSLCDLLRVPCSEEVEGRSWMPTLTGDEAMNDTEVTFSESPSRQTVALQTARYKAIVRPDDIALYDLQEDPGELRDRAAELPFAVTAMRDLLGDHLRRGTAQKGRISAPRASSTPDPAPMDEETTERLRALGYVE